MRRSTRKPMAAFHNSIVRVPADLLDRPGSLEFLKFVAWHIQRGDW